MFPQYRFEWVELSVLGRSILISMLIVEHVDLSPFPSRTNPFSPR